MGGKYGLGNNLITGDVIDASCSPADGIDSTEITQITGTVRRDPTLTLPPPLPVPTICTGSLVYPTTCGARRLDAINDNLTLPRTGIPTDTPNANGEYIYYVAKDGSNKSIDLSGTKNLVIRPGTKVTLYLEGNIDTNGSGVKIGHNCTDTSIPPDGGSDGSTTVPGCEPTNFQIYGGTGTTSLVLGGSNTIDAFIFAPNAVESGVNGSASIRGSVWLKQWDRANGRHTVIVQTGGWNNIPLLLRPPRLAPLNSWQQQETP